MDPNNNLVAGVSPAPEPTPVLNPEYTATPDVSTMQNPAVDVANAAMAGATPVVTTTDLNAADVAPEPTLQMPVLDTTAMEAEAAADESGPVSLAPSADFQMGEVSTVSAVQNGENGNLAEAASIGDPMSDPTVDQLANTEMPASNPNQGPGAADFTNAEQADANGPVDFGDEPLEAAKPVPGSIGSAKSYTDIQREEAEKAARMAAKKNAGSKLGTKQIGIIAGAAVAVIGLGVGAFFMLNSNESKPTPTSTYVAPAEPVLTSLSCKKNMQTDEYAIFGAVSGNQENIFYFSDDVLSGLETNLNYTFADLNLATLRKNEWIQFFGITEEPEKEESEAGEETEEPAADEGTEDVAEVKKTVEQMLKHKVFLKDLVLTHRQEVTSEDIEQWLKSEGYSDQNYGAPAKTEQEKDSEEDDGEEEINRNLEFYQKIQNGIGFSCSVVE